MTITVKNVLKMRRFSSSDKRCVPVPTLANVAA
jgi:hypothetical protein